jgi:hypothetical protein
VLGVLASCFNLATYIHICMMRILQIDEGSYIPMCAAPSEQEHPESCTFCCLSYVVCLYIPGDLINQATFAVLPTSILSSHHLLRSASACHAMPTALTSRLHHLPTATTATCPQILQLPQTTRRISFSPCTTSASRGPSSATCCTAPALSSHCKSSKPACARCRLPARPRARTRCQTSAG